MSKCKACKEHPVLSLGLCRDCFIVLRHFQLSGYLTDHIRSIGGIPAEDICGRGEFVHTSNFSSTDQVHSYYAGEAPLGLGSEIAILNKRKEDE